MFSGSAVATICHCHSVTQGTSGSLVWTYRHIAPLYAVLCIFWGWIVLFADGCQGTDLVNSQCNDSRVAFVHSQKLQCIHSLTVHDHHNDAVQAPAAWHAHIPVV